MCGINGGYKIGTEAVKKMVSATCHRGPDATGVRCVGDAVFGHNRLAIIDTSEKSNQPMLSPDGRYMLVFNGEIYNFKKIKNELIDWKFTSAGDSEVLLASLITYGEAALEKIEGIFSFAFYDFEKNCILLARDHLGVKPLYYQVTDSTLYFSSELKGILSVIDNPVLDLESVSQFLHFNYVPSPKTLVKNVKKLRPGHLFRFKQGKCEIESYYTPVLPTRRKVSHVEMRSVIGNEVKSQLISDRPLGVLLSGGFDSSIVLHHASQHGEMKTFSTGFEMSLGAETQYDKFNADAVLAKKTADYYGAKHTDFTITLDMIRDDMINIIEQLDEPVNSPTQISQYLLTRFIKSEGIVVALGGDGGDELWGGYIRHTAVLSAQYLQSLPKFMQSIGGSIHPKIKKMSQPLGAHIHWDLTVLNQSGSNRILKQDLPRAADYGVVEDRYLQQENMAPIEMFMRADRELWLADDSLQRTDRSSMANAVEVRVPLLGMSVVNFADSIHATSKFNIWKSKKVLKEAYSGHLPAHLYNQPKRGWMAPGAKWLRDERIEEIVRSVFTEKYYDGLSGLFDWDELQQLLTEHVETKGYHLNPIWNILVLQIWARAFNVKFK